MNKVYLSIILGFAMIPFSGCSQTDSVVTETNSKSLVGAYTQYHEVSKEENDFFSMVYDQERVLVPIRVATQVVAGTNYLYLCKDADGQLYEVVIFKPLPNGGEPQVTNIRKSTAK